MQVKSIGEHSAILTTFIKLPFVFKTFVLSSFEWLLKTGFTVGNLCSSCKLKLFVKIKFSQKFLNLLQHVFKGEHQVQQDKWTNTGLLVINYLYKS